MDIPAPTSKTRAMHAPADVQSPQFTQGQLAWLHKQFPIRIFHPSATPAEMHHYFGQQEIIRAIEKQLRVHAARN